MDGMFVYDKLYSFDSKDNISGNVLIMHYAKLLY